MSKLKVNEITDLADNPLYATLYATLFPTGSMKETLFGVETGWVLMEGLSIGNATSNATARANADTEALYTKLWNTFGGLIVYTSVGSVTVRGASAAADYAASKALEVPSRKATVPRGTGTITLTGTKTGPSVGEVQGDFIGSHSHGTNTSTQNGNMGARVWGNSSNNMHAQSVTIGSWNANDYPVSGASVTLGTGYTRGAMVVGTTSDNGAGNQTTTAENRVVSFGVQWLIKL